MTPLLQQLWQTLNDGRTTADNAARALTGEATPDMGMGGMAGGAMPGGEMPPEPNAAIPQPGGDEFGATDAAAGGAEELGRDRR